MEPQRFLCSRVWMKNGGLIPWNALVFDEMFKTSNQMANLLMKGDLVNHSVGQQFLLDRWWNFIRFPRKTRTDSINLFKKVLPGIFIEYVLYAGRIWNGAFLVADVEEL